VNDRNRWIALVVLCTGMLMIVLDNSLPGANMPHPLVTELPEGEELSVRGVRVKGLATGRPGVARRPRQRQ
jgi:hypothetical protein